MKKIGKILLFAFMSILVFPFSMFLTGCSHGSIKVGFYDADYNLICTDNYEFKNYEDHWGVLIDSIKPPDISTQLTGYTILGWKIYEPQTNETKDLIWNFDGTHGLNKFGSDISFVVACEIDDSDWVYSGSGQNANAFVWSSGTYASTALRLQTGSNTIRSDKTITTEKLRDLKIFQNGGSGHYISGIEIRDEKGRKVSFGADNFKEDISLYLQNPKEAMSLIIRIETTQAFEAGIMIGSDID